MLIDQILRQRYKIIERIGGGGFGDTYLAIDLDFPGERQCVVKHLSPKNSAPDAVAIAKRLFQSEAECLSRQRQKLACMKFTNSPNTFPLLLALRSHF